jgi:hypothetical protein
LHSEPSHRLSSHSKEWLDAAIGSLLASFFTILNRRNPRRLHDHCQSVELDNQKHLRRASRTFLDKTENMTMKNKTRALRLSLVYAMALCLMSTTVPTDLADTVAEAAPVGDPAELRLLAELADWVSYDTKTGSILESASIGVAIRERPESFDLFRRFHGDDHLRLRLEELPFGDSIRRAAERHGLDALLLASLVAAESSFDPLAVSSHGAIGLTQILPSTAERPWELLTIPEINLDEGASYLKQLLDLYDGDLELALAAYNAGPGNVRRFGGVPPFVETTHYVSRVLGTYLDHHRKLWQSTEEGELLALL